MKDSKVQPLDLSDEAISNFFNQMVQSYIVPEIQRRKGTDVDTEPVQIFCFQIIFNLFKEVEVRLNSEVKAAVTARATRPVDKGEKIYFHDVKEFGEIKLIGEDANAAHVTAIALSDGSWHIGFNFNYNSAIRREKLDAAKQFIQVSEYALTNGHYRAFHENLFSAMECLAVATLITLPNEQWLENRKHSLWQSEMNKWRKLGNINGEYVELFNKLSNDRASARYSFEPFALDQNVAKTMLSTATQFFEYTSASIPKLVALGQEN